MALNLTDNWQMAKILTDYWHLYPPIQTLQTVYFIILRRTKEWKSVTL